MFETAVTSTATMPTLITCTTTTRTRKPLGHPFRQLGPGNLPAPLTSVPTSPDPAPSVVAVGAGSRKDRGRNRRCIRSQLQPQASREFVDRRR